MKRLLVSIALVCALVVGGVVLDIPNIADTPNVYAQGIAEGASLQVGTQSLTPYGACSTGLTGLGDLGCQIGIFFVYGVWFRLTNALATLAAYLADYALWLSVQSNFYRFGDLMIRGWEIVRNFVNIGFIVALLYAGVQLILGKSNGSRILVRIILCALLVNFSLFGARLIIDFGNITARAIYTQIKYSSTPGTEGISTLPGQVRISEAILSTSNPQAVLFSDIGDQADSDFIWKMFTMFFLMGIVNIMLIFVFLSMAILFLTRTISLVVLAILVPIPIVVDLIPVAKSAVQKMKGAGSVFSLENWFTEYWKLSAMAPVYVFFLYLIVIVQSGYSKIQSLQPTGIGFIGSVFTAMLPIIITFFLIKFASKITKDFSGTFGALVTSGLNTVIGMVGGGALGLAARGTRIAGGRLGRGLQRAGALTTEERESRIAAAEAKSGKNSLRARLARNRYSDKNSARLSNVGSYMANTATYDPRQIKNTGTFKKFAGTSVGKKFLNETGQQVVSDIKWGKPIEKSYNVKDKERSHKEEQRAAQYTKDIQKSMDDVTGYRNAQIARTAADSAVGQQRAAEVRVDAALMDDPAALVHQAQKVVNSLPPNATPEQRQAAERDLRIAQIEYRTNARQYSQADIAQAEGEAKRIKDELKSATADYDTAKASGDKELMRTRYQAMEAVKQRLAAAERTVEETKFNKENYSHLSITDMEGSVAMLEANIRNGKEALRVEKEALEREEKKQKETQGVLSKERAALEKRKTDLEKLRAAQVKFMEDKRAAGTVTQEQEDLHTRRMDAFALTEDGINRDDTNLKTQEQKLTLDAANTKSKQDAAKAREKQFEDDKKKADALKKSVEARQKKKAELEKSVEEKTYLYDDSEALQHAKALEELKQKYKKASPEGKQQLLQELGFHADLITKFKEENKDNQVALLSLEKALIGQASLDKEVMQQYIAEQSIERMKNGYRNIGKKVGAALVTTGAVVAGAGVVATAGAPLLAVVAAGAITGAAVNAGRTSIADKAGEVTGKAGAGLQNVVEKLERVAYDDSLTERSTERMRKK